MADLRRRNNPESITPASTTGSKYEGRKRRVGRSSCNPLVLAGAFCVLVVMFLLGMWAASGSSEREHKRGSERRIETDDQGDQGLRTKFQEKPPLPGFAAKGNEGKGKNTEQNDAEYFELEHELKEDYYYDYGSGGSKDSVGEDYDYAL